MDFGPVLPRTCRIGIGDAGRVHIAAIRLPHDAADAVEIDQRMQPLCLVPAYLMEVHSVKPRLCRLKPQLMLPRLGLRKVKATRLENATALPGLGLQFLIQVHRIVLNAGNIGIVV